MAQHTISVSNERPDCTMYGLGICRKRTTHGCPVVCPGYRPKDSTSKAPDPVNHPEHYTSGSIECIDALRASMPLDQFMGFLKGNVIKYLWRYQQKGKPVQDLEKARWYLDKLIDLWKENEE